MVLPFSGFMSLICLQKVGNSPLLIVLEIGTLIVESRDPGKTATLRPRAPAPSERGSAAPQTATGQNETNVQ